MSAPLNLIGQVFGRLTVLSKAESKNGRTHWVCICSCGNTVTVNGHYLQNGTKKSCGCLQAETRSKNRTTHHASKTRLYNIYRGMKGRCLNKRNDKFRHYGGRGISVAPEWLQDYESFRDWALANGYRDDLTLDRIDVNGNYEPSNCRWVTMREQTRNTRFNTKYKEKCISEWAEIVGIRPEAISHRLQRGWSFEKAISTPLLRKSK